MTVPSRAVFCRVQNVTIEPGPVQQPCPTWIASNPRPFVKPEVVDAALRRVAQKADGWMTEEMIPRVTLADALGMATDEVVAVVGGGGKTTAMFRLAQEMVARGGRAITTTTTRIFAAQIQLSPAHVPAALAARENVLAALAAHGQVLVIGETDPGTGKAEGVSLDLFRVLRAWCPDACILNEADGSRMRPFKAPAAHEPVVPGETTLVVPMVGADIFGKPLDADHVHRPELVSTLSGAALGAPITPEIVARTLAHPDGGRKGVPAGARVIVVINKVERLPDRDPARETAERLLREPAIQVVLLAELRGAEPVLEVYRR
jgi:probable selenium-dependent hydroxylase accessory protein YqeC